MVGLWRTYVGTSATGISVDGKSKYHAEGNYTVGNSVLILTAYALM